MEKIILIVHLLTALAIIGMILLQQGKGAEAGASFGAGASQTILGSAGGWNFFSKITAILATLFFVTSVSLAVIAKDKVAVDDKILPELEAIQQMMESDVPSVEDGEDIPVAPGGDTGSTSDIPVPGTAQ
ncbi:preprotein translocase subunit SecG [uncultured Porticoccus sp.]|uniref:preprotein translocase subunit SecG n=1 Tax=uncultured Porticoccus sp. TaxID=1256050 RepID=UPI002612400E|nr:preprotein translocase subunit SecG [uncultured Porticoccus sp.]